MVKPHWMRKPGPDVKERFRLILDLLKKKSPRTVRNISYSLYPDLEGGELDNKYNLTIKDTVRMRMWELIPFDAIKESRTHVHEINNSDTIDDFIDYLESIDLSNLYHKNKKPCFKVPIEVWFEKDTVSDVFQEVCDKYTIPMLCVRGKSQVSSIRKGFERFKSYLRLRNGGHVLFFGDNDKSGKENYEDIRYKFKFWKSECSFHWCGVTDEQIEKYGIPGYRLDGFNDEDLAEILEECILKYVDKDKFNELTEQENQEKELLKNYSILVDRGDSA